MGTNYYFYEEPACPHCGYQAKPLHIGKSSGGWVFALHAYPEKGINDLDDWIDIFKASDTQVKNEYNVRVSSDTMLAIIIGRQFAREEPESDSWYQTNHAVPGPNGLARSKIDGIYCIGHGEGTWDLHVGEFS